jgi:hypothetical protein
MRQRFGHLFLINLLGWCAETTTLRPVHAVMAQVGRDPITTQDVLDAMRMLVALQVFQRSMDKDKAPKLDELPHRMEDLSASDQAGLLQSLIDDRVKARAILHLRRIPLPKKGGLIPLDAIVPVEQLNQEIARREKMFGHGPGTLKKILSTYHVSFDVYCRQLAYQLVWNDYILLLQKGYKPAQREIDALIAMLQRKKKEDLYFMGEIVVYEGHTPQARQKAQKMIQEIHHLMQEGKTHFSQLVERYSQASSKDNQGLLGWKALSDLPVELQQAARRNALTTVPMCLDPVRVAFGAHGASYKWVFLLLLRHQPANLKDQKALSVQEAGDILRAQAFERRNQSMLQLWRKKLVVHLFDALP